MNRNEIISLLVFLSAMGLSHLAAGAIQRRILPLVKPWLGPLLERLFPLLKMEPWLFEPIAFDDLPKAQQRFFETHTPGFVIRGFTHLGDFVLRRDGEPSCARFFLSRDSTVIGGMSCYLGQQAIECISVLADGFYLETASMDCSQLPPAKHGLQFFALRTDDSGELIEHHIACVAKTAADRNTFAAPLEASDLSAVVNYGRQLSLNSLHQQGVLGELPEFLREKSEAAEEKDGYALEAR